MALCPMEGLSGQGRRNHGISLLAEPKPLARWSSTLAGQPERAK